jgi:hypothetical protein
MIELDEFWVKIAKSAPQTRTNSLIAKFTETAQKHFANGETLCPGQNDFGLLAYFRVGGAFRSFSFIVLQLYNPKTTSKQFT